MHESPLFSTPTRETTAQRLARPVTFRSLRQRIARVGMIAITVASLAGAGSVSAAPPFDARGCTLGDAVCIATGGVLYPYLADPNAYLGNGNGAPYYGGGAPFGYGYGYGYGAYGNPGNGNGNYGYGSYGTYGYGSYGYPQCVTYDHDCDLPGTAAYGFLVNPPPMAKPFSAYPSTALVTPTPIPVPMPPTAPRPATAVPALPAAASVTPVAASATATASATPQTIIVPPVGAASSANNPSNGSSSPNAPLNSPAGQSGNAQTGAGGSTMGAASGAVQTGGSGSPNTNPTGGSVPGRVGSTP